MGECWNTKGSGEAIFLSKVISLTCWKLDPADIGLPLIIVLYGANSLEFIYIQYMICTQCVLYTKIINYEYHILHI